ncbi:pimeloyl-ACP methyl ester esterase BioH [Aestuariibacter sp. GS-14]|uniref:pimeloyl-ACP methyl ester esterase BioH n=1 Tax=Aestuariibacter sp. GS-14 TaxID=2590670 RepID=UPI00112CE436|nr:pimeloyl-ACP methyl ester esterase BioH [Aestuariibacter sp. GS-14]TPV59137.1 pimeloyl-ACP methyl ester esterase BioH [Aestuariibacter sp. GS-14]
MVERNTNVRLESLSQGTGKELVFIHGWGMNSAVFTGFLPYLRDQFRITRVCLPGFGANASTLPDEYTLESLAEAVASILPDNAIVVGWSLGGLVAQHLALYHSKRVAGLITIASTPYFVADKCWPGIAPAVLTMFREQLARDYDKTVDRFLAIQAMGSATAKQDVKSIRQQVKTLPNPSLHALEAGLQLLQSVDLRSDIGRISQPTLRLYGRLDSLVPTSGIDRIHELHPSADTVVMPHAAHAPFISHPTQTADIISNFVHNLTRIDKHCS